MTSKISKSVIEQIKKDKIQPKSKWNFMAKNYAFWILAVFMIIMGAIAISIIIFVIFDLDWDLYKYRKTNPVLFFLRTIPFLWIILFSLFTYLGYLIFRKTKKGYRYNFIFFSLIVAGLSLIFGIFFYYSGFSEFLERTTLCKLPFSPNRIDQWTSPESGFLAGEVIALNKDYIEIIDLENKKWKVILPEKQVGFLRDKLQNNLKNDKFREKAEEKMKGLRLKIIGEKIDNTTFKAHDVRPWFHRPPFGPKQEYFRPMKQHFKQNNFPVK